MHRPTEARDFEANQRERRGGWKIEEGLAAGRINESSAQMRADRASAAPVGAATQAHDSAKTWNRGIGVEDGEGADLPEHCGPEHGFGSSGPEGVIRAAGSSCPLPSQPINPVRASIPKLGRSGCEQLAWSGRGATTKPMTQNAQSAPRLDHRRYLGRDARMATSPTSLDSVGMIGIETGGDAPGSYLLKPLMTSRYPLVWSEILLVSVARYPELGSDQE